jgi:hypothetical protein
MPPEPWGRRLTRAREDVAGLTLDEAATLAGRWMLTSKATISRLEAQNELPIGHRSASRRQLAYVLCLAYRVDPADFGLGSSDLPPGLRIPHRRHHGASTSWYDVQPELPLLLPA